MEELVSEILKLLCVLKDASPATDESWARSPWRVLYGSAV